MFKRSTAAIATLALFTLASCGDEEVRNGGSIIAGTGTGAVGGGGSSAPEPFTHTPSTTATTAITEANAPTLAANAYFSANQRIFNNGTFILSAANYVVTLFNETNSTVGQLTITCNISGSYDITVNDVDNSTDYTSGDTVSVSYNNCRADRTGGMIETGTINFTNITISDDDPFETTGDVAGMFRTTNPNNGFSLTLDVDYQFDDTLDDNGIFIYRQIGANSRYTITRQNNQNNTLEFTGLNVVTDFSSNTAIQTQSLMFAMTENTTNSVDVFLTENYTRNPIEGTVSGGSFIVNAAGNTAARVVFTGGQNVRLELDTTGDRNVDTTIDTTLDELGLNYIY